MLDFEEGWNNMIADLKESKTFDTKGERTTFTLHCIGGRLRLCLKHAKTVLSISHS